MLCVLLACSVCGAFEGMSVALLRELDCVFLKNKSMERKSWMKCFPFVLLGFYFFSFSFECSKSQSLELCLLDFLKPWKL